MLFRELWRRRGPFLAITVTALLGVMLFGASYDAYRNLEASYQQMFVTLRFADLTVEGGDLDGFVARARAVDGVETVATRAVREVPVEVRGKRLIAQLIGVPVGEQPSVNELLVLDGTYLAEGSGQVALIERHLADHFGVGPGDEVRVFTATGWQPLGVLGVVASAEYVWPARSRQQVFTSPDTFGVLFVPPAVVESGPQPATRQALVYLNPGAERSGALEQLQRLASEADAAGVVTRAEQPSNALLQEDIQGFGELAVLFPFLFLGAAMVAAFVIITRLVQEQRQTIGTLLACGVRSRAILLHHLGYGFVPGTIGALVGAISGSLAAAAITRAYTSALDIPITVARFHPATAVGGFVLAVVALTLAAGVPAYRASRIQPAVAMSGGTGPSSGRASLAERVAPILKRLPASLKLVMRSLGRHPGRSLTTALGVILALLMVMISWGMLDTVQVLVDRQFDVIQRHDAEVVPAAGLEAAIAAIDKVVGVGAVEPIVVAEVEASAGGDHANVGVRGFPAGTRMHRFRAPSGELMALPTEGALVAVSLRDRLGLQVGDALTLRLSDVGTDTTVRVQGFVDEPLGTWVYVQQPIETDAGAPIEPSVALVQLDEGADAASTLTAIEHLPSVAVVVGTRTLEAQVRDLMSLFYVFVGVMLALGAVLAFALIYAAMSVNVAARTRELATLRALGVGPWRLALIVAGENLLVAVLSLVPGLPLAYLTAAAFMASFSSPLFRFELAIRPGTWIVACVSVLFAVLASQLPALRSVARLDLATAVRTG